MKSPTQRILVRCKDLYEYFVTHGNLTLYVDPLFKKGQHKITCGEVVAVPDGVLPWCRIIPEVQVGDKIYFHYNALREDSVIPDLEGIWVIEYDFVFCVVRDGKIIPIGGKVFASPLYDDGVQDIEVNGTVTKGKISEKTGLITEINSKHSLKKARLAHIGTPLRGDVPVAIKVGDVFYYISNADFRNTIEGTEYFVMNQEDILATEEI
jgi:co-chaperonin GroES (HSP10)